MTISATLSSPVPGPSLTLVYLAENFVIVFALSVILVWEQDSIKH